MKKAYVLDAYGRLIPTNLDEILPNQVGNTGLVLETDGTISSWGSKLKNKGYGLEVTNAQYIQGYIVMSFAPVNVESIRVQAIGASLQLSEDLALSMPNTQADFAYRFEAGEHRLYFVDSGVLVVGLAVAPENLFSENQPYVVYCDTLD